MLKAKLSKHRARRVRRPLKRRPELPFAGKSKRRENSGDQSLGIHRAVPAHPTSTERVETRSSFLVRRRRDARQLKVARPQPRPPAPRADPEGQFVYNYLSNGRDRENNCTKPHVTHSWLVSKEQCGTHARCGRSQGA